MTTQTRLSAKGQVVIPKDVRDRLGLVEGMVFDVIERGGEVVLRRGGAATGRTAADALREIRSFYRYDGPRLSIEDMDKALEEARAVHYRKKYGK